MICANCDRPLSSHGGFARCTSGESAWDTQFTPAPIVYEVWLAGLWGASRMGEFGSRGAAQAYIADNLMDRKDASIREVRAGVEA